MPTQVYCNRDDIESQWSPVALLRCVDDDHDGVLSPRELGTITQAIERAANKMNASLEMRYSLAALQGNTWCRDANAAIAAYFLATRRGNPAPDHIQELSDGYLADLAEIRRGRMKTPQVSESLPHTPVATNFRAEFRPEGLSPRPTPIRNERDWP